MGKWIYIYTRDQVTITTSLEKPQRMKTPGTACFYGTIGYNPEQTRLKSTLLLHLRHQISCQQNNFRKHRCRVNITRLSESVFLG